MYSTAQRFDLVSALRVVDEVVIYQDVEADIRNFDFDIFAIGEDQVHHGFCEAVEYCLANQKEVVRMTRTPGICSSAIKRSLD